MQSVTGPGRVVAGRYELLDAVGHGAMGTVWRAQDLLLTRQVAVKEVRLPGPMSPQDLAVLRERSMREARVAARLTHPGVVTVHDVIEDTDSPWIIMELVPSRSLAQVLAEDGPMSPARAAAMGMTLLDALGTAHAAGIVHRDVKPGNILVTSSGRVVLTDFGIATMHGDPQLTQAGMVMGTPGFCAPERIRGAPASAASDLWSLGATLYATVEGRGPFEGLGSAMAVLSKIVHADPPPAASAGPLAPVITALMHRDPGARPDAAGARRLLSAACTGAGRNGSGVAAATAAKAADRSTAGADRSAAGVAGRNGAATDDRSGPAAASRSATGTARGSSAAAGGRGATGTARGSSAAATAQAVPAPTPPVPAAPLSVPPLFGQPKHSRRTASQPASGQRASGQRASGQRATGQRATGQRASGRPRADKAATPPATSPAAASAAPSAPADSLDAETPHVPGTTPAPGDPKRRPGRHRRALLFGGGGATVVLAVLMIAVAHAARLAMTSPRRAWLTSRDAFTEALRAFTPRP